MTLSKITKKKGRESFFKRGFFGKLALEFYSKEIYGTKRCLPCIHVLLSGLWFFLFYELFTLLITRKRKKINKTLSMQSKQFLLLFYFLVYRIEFQNSIQDWVLTSSKRGSVSALINPWSCLPNCREYLISNEIKNISVLLI